MWKENAKKNRKLSYMYEKYQSFKIHSSYVLYKVRVRVHSFCYSIWIHHIFWWYCICTTKQHSYIVHHISHEQRACNLTYLELFSRNITFMCESETYIYVYERHEKLWSSTAAASEHQGRRERRTTIRVQRAKMMYENGCRAFSLSIPPHHHDDDTIYDSLRLWTWMVQEISIELFSVHRTRFLLLCMWIGLWLHD